MTTTIAHAQAAARLRTATARLSRMLRRQDVGALTLSLWSALDTIDERGPMRIGELADVEHVSAPTATRLVAALATDGLVTRAADPRDRRSAIVRATVAGSEALARLRRARTERLSTRLATLSDDELMRLLDALPVLEALAAE